MAHVPHAQMDRDRWTKRLIAAVTVSFVALGIVVALWFPDSEEGPTPGNSKLAWFAWLAVFAVGLAAIPLVLGLLERRAGRWVGLRWQVVLVGGVVLAMAVVGFGVWEWAFPPLHTECFVGYRYPGNGAARVAFHICEDGRVNRALGLSRMNDGVIGGGIVLLLTAAATMRLRTRDP